MKSIACGLASLLLVAAAPLRAEETPRAEPPRDSYVPFELSLFTPVNLFHPDRKIITGLSINVVYGRSTSTYGIELGAIVNRNTEDMGGVQFAGLVNVVGGRVSGIEIAGLVNAVGGKTDGTGVGLQLAGLVNDGGWLGGFQLAGIANSVDRSPFVLQLAPLANIATRGATAVQLGLVNDAMEHFAGLQVGFMNFAAQTIPLPTGATRCEGARCGSEYKSTIYLPGRMTGAQIGLFNRGQRFDGFAVGALFTAYDKEVRALQVSGLVNGAGDLAGLQIGTANIARDVRGVQIGLINIGHELTGVQIGAINVATGNKWPFMIGILPGF